MCMDGYRNLCPDVVFAGHGCQDGGLQQYLAWPSWALHPLPDGMTAVDGAMLEPLGVALHALDLGHVRIGSTVAVVGCGPIGLLLLELPHAACAVPSAAVNPLPHRRDAATRYGAPVALDPAAARGAWAELAGPGV